jgi:hypothetical protein
MAKTERRITHRLGKSVVDGARLRSVPAVELPWITTFNLRWWRHLADDESRRVEAEPAGKVGIPG